MPLIRTGATLAAVALATASALVLVGCSAGGSSAPPKDQGDAGAKPKASATISAPKILDTSKVDACTKLTQQEAETVAGATLTPGVTVSTTDVASCTYAGDPNGPTAQVEVYIGTGAKQQLDIDKDQLQHPFTQPTGVGDEAWQEDYMIWGRTGTTWASIRLVRLEDAAGYTQTLQDAMKVLLGRLA